MKILALFFLFTCFASANANPINSNITMLSLFKKADPIEKFWSWFKENEQRLRNFETDPDKYLDEIIRQAKKVKNGLAIELEPPANGIINMTISADGDRNLFDLVRNMVAQSPVIPGWKFIAFRQRMNLEQFKDIKLTAADHELDPQKMKFLPIYDGDSLDIIIYVPGITEANFNQVAYGGLLMLDNLLGEYDCVTKVRSYDFHLMPVKKEELEELMPLLEIASFVDRFHAEKNK